MPLLDLIHEWRETLAQRAREDIDLLAAEKAAEEAFQASERLSLAALEEQLARCREEAVTQISREGHALKERHAEELAALIKKHEDEAMGFGKSTRQIPSALERSERVGREALERTLSQNRTDMIDKRASDRDLLLSSRRLEDEHIKEKVLPSFFADAANANFSVSLGLSPGSKTKFVIPDQWPQSRSSKRLKLSRSPEAEGEASVEFKSSRPSSPQTPPPDEDLEQPSNKALYSIPAFNAAAITQISSQTVFKLTFFSWDDYSDETSGGVVWNASFTEPCKSIRVDPNRQVFEIYHGHYCETQEHPEWLVNGQDDGQLRKASFDKESLRALLRRSGCSEMRMKFMDLRSFEAFMVWFRGYLEGKLHSISENVVSHPARVFPVMMMANSCL